MRGHQAQIPFPSPESGAVAIGDGAIWLKHLLPLAEQRALRIARPPIHDQREAATNGTVETTP